MTSMNDSEAEHAAERLRSAGLRATGPRIALLTALGRDRRHPTAEQVHETLRGEHPSISLSTVYDGLEALVRVGLCRRVATGDGRLRVDGLTDEHDHAVCRDCGTIYDIEPGRFPRPARMPRLPHGLRATALRVEYEVVCADCRAGVHGN
jgi:Fe2+ or Zn2+ uptake regulation protein